MLDCEHGSLPSAKEAFPAFVDLLASGSTARLPTLAEADATRGVAGARRAPHVRSRPSRGQLSALPAQTTRSVFDADRGRAVQAQDTPRGAALRITVLNGNLSFIRQPLLLGHYRAAALTGTEAVVDRLVGGSMQAALDAGLYPDAVGTHQIFVNTWRSPDNPWRAPRPQCAVVVGLGDEGVLTEMRLRDSVRQAVIAWAQRVVEEPAASRRRDRDRGHAAGQRRHGHLAQRHRARHRTRRARGQRPAGRQRLAAGGPAHAGGAVPGPRLRSLARPAGAGHRQPRPFRTGAHHRQRHRAAAPAGRQRLSRRRSRLHHRHRRRAARQHRLHAGHAARAHRDAGADDAGQAAARPGGARVHRRQRRPADRPHPVPAAGADRDRALPGRHAAHAAGTGRPHRAHSLGAAGNARRRPWPRRPSTLGHPLPVAAQAAQGELPRRAARRRRRGRGARDRRAGGRSRPVRPVARRAGRGAGGGGAAQRARRVWRPIA